MTSTEDSGLRGLARGYYKGEMSYESYRSARTQLLDELSNNCGDQSCQTMPFPSSGGEHVKGRQRPDSQHVANQLIKPWYRRGMVWGLMVIIIIAIFVAWTFETWAKEAFTEKRCQVSSGIHCNVRGLTSSMAESR